jgi:hypothetical protein
MRHWRVVAVCWAVSLTAGSVQAELVRFEIESRVPFANGAEFGKTGPYEVLRGRAVFEFDPALEANRSIVDLALAPRNDKGQVECVADVCVLAPVDPARGNGCLLYEVNNRGNKGIVGFFNQGGGGNDVASAGDGFLMRRGFTIVWSGWDGELLAGGERMRLRAPVAKGTGDGATITGRVRCEFVPGSASRDRLTVTSWANHGSYRPTSANFEGATLSVRPRPEAPRLEIPRDQWIPHLTDDQPDEPAQLPKIEIEPRFAWQAGAIYEFIYEARDPLVMGCSFTTVRDLISALREGSGVGNPYAANTENVKRPFRHALAFGISQSGRFLRDFLHTTGNADERGRLVFDGLIPHVSGSGMGSFNHRFAQPTRHAQQHDHDDYPVDRFPFSYSTQLDPLTGRRDGLCAKAMKLGTVPKILHTQSAGEYWTRAGSLTHTDPTGTRDEPIPDNVRVYLFGGTQHGPAGYPPKLSGEYANNHGDFKPMMRALLIDLVEWVRDGTPAPASTHPTISNGTLVTLADWQRMFPDLGTGRPIPALLRHPPCADYGDRWFSDGFVDRQPPVVRGRYTCLVPAPGKDGNDRATLLPPEVAVPLGTHTGWNLRTAKQGATGQLVSLTGSYIPFARTIAERKESGDARGSLEERYGLGEAGVATFRADLGRVVNDYVQQRLLLPDDAARLLEMYTERAKTVLAP